MRAKTLLKTAASVAAVAALTTGCLSSGGGDEPSAGSSGGSVEGSTVTVWLSVDQPVVDGLQAAVKEKADALGMTITLQKVENINQLIVTKVQAGDPPDIAMIPQPGVVRDLANRGALTPLDDILDMASLESDMTAGTLDAGRLDDKLYGLLVSMNVKSLVFYPKKAWDAAGYEVPDSIGALNDLTDQIKADGTTPWCMGIGSEAATGWPATDWFEDLIMRYGGVDGYNSWVTHETLFDSELVRQAAAEFEQLMFTDGNVVGGRSAIASTAFGTAGNPLFDTPAGCMLLKQGSFISTFFPDNIQADLESEVGVFGFPPAEAGGENPVLGGGDLAVLLKDSAASEQAMKILSDPSIGVGVPAVEGSNYISPFKTFDTSLYPNSIQKSAAEVAYSSTAFLFDGSDQMPGAVGAGTFWRDITAWISGQEDLDQALTNIDESWPAS